MKHTVFSSIMLMLGSARASPAGLKSPLSLPEVLASSSLKFTWIMPRLLPGKSTAFLSKGAELLTITVNYSGTMEILT